MFRDHVGPERLDDLLGTFEKMGQSHPDEPHWYLPMSNITLYERHGFEVMGTIQVGAAPPVTPMLRRPR